MVLFNHVRMCPYVCGCVDWYKFSAKKSKKMNGLRKKENMSQKMIEKRMQTSSSGAETGVEAQI